MKGGARLRLDLDEGGCETLHYITIHQKTTDFDEGWCETLHYITTHHKRIDLFFCRRPFIPEARSCQLSLTRGPAGIKPPQAVCQQHKSDTIPTTTNIFRSSADYKLKGSVLKISLSM